MRNTGSMNTEKGTCPGEQHLPSDRHEFCSETLQDAKGTPTAEYFFIFSDGSPVHRAFYELVLSLLFCSKQPAMAGV